MVREVFVDHSVYFDVVEMYFVYSVQIDIPSKRITSSVKFVGIISRCYYLIFSGVIDNRTVAGWLAAGRISAVTSFGICQLDGYSAYMQLIYTINVYACLV
jgi:hypothetical protein